MKWFFLAFINCAALIFNVWVISSGDYMWANVGMAIVCGILTAACTILYVRDANARDDEDK